MEDIENLLKYNYKGINIETGEWVYGNDADCDWVNFIYTSKRKTVEVFKSCYKVEGLFDTAGIPLFSNDMVLIEGTKGVKCVGKNVDTEVKEFLKQRSFKIVGNATKDEYTYKNLKGIEKMFYKFRYPHLEYHLIEPFQINNLKNIYINRKIKLYDTETV